MTAAFDDPFELEFELGALARDDAAAEGRRLDAPVLFRFFELDPFELRELVGRFDVERVLAWAMAPP